MGQLVTAGRLLGGVKTGPQKILTDSRFPGTTELLSTASVELKGVRANLESEHAKVGARADISARVLGFDRGTSFQLSAS